MTRPKPIPDGYGTVTPWIIGPDTDGLIRFLVAAFDAEEISRLTDEAGRIGHAEVRLGTSIVMCFDTPLVGRAREPQKSATSAAHAPEPDWPATPAFLRLYLRDADASFAQALAAGATAVTEVTHLAFGDRVGRVRDPFGNLYWLQTRVEEVSAEEMTRRWTDPEWAKRMEYVQGARFFG